MSSVFLAAVLAGSALCAISYIFVAVTGAPVWLGLKTFLITWVADVTVMTVGLTILHAIIRFVPVVHCRLQNEIRKFVLYCSLALLVGCAGLVAMVVKDVQVGRDFWTLLLVIALIGLPTILMVGLSVRQSRAILVRAITASVVLILTANGVYFAIDQQYAAEIKQRSTQFKNTIPSIFLLVMDTARSDHFSCNGYQFPTTPHIDRIAAEGANWPNAFSAANWTPPGHISIFTGKYPIQHGNNGKPYMPEELLSLTEVLRQEGYYCVSMYENPLAGKSINLTQGFDYDFGVLHNSWIYTIPLRLWDKLAYNDDGAYVTFATAQRVYDWVTQKGGHPFLYVNIAEPHVPYRANQPYFDHFTKGLDRSKVGDLSRIWDLCVTRDLILQDSVRFAGLTEESIAYMRAVYDSELAYDDEHFGRLTEWMHTTGNLDRTLMIITADHGEVLGEHWTMGHEYTLFKPAVHIPMIMRYPGAIKPAQRDEYVSNVDIFPTVLYLMSRQDLIPSDVAGMDMLSLNPSTARPLISSNLHRGGQFSLLTNGYKLILSREENNRQYSLPDTLLYDLSNDLHEIADLHITQNEQSEKMLTQLNDWVDRYYVATTDSVQISSEALENMKALGYVH
jgi:arylsulfatase A-like enzyme